MSDPARPFDPILGILADYRLALGDTIEVELLTPIAADAGLVRPRLVVGTVASASPVCLFLRDHREKLIRVPFTAVAAIRDNVTHPGL